MINRYDLEGINSIAQQTDVTQTCVQQQHFYTSGTASVSKPCSCIFHTHTVRPCRTSIKKKKNCRCPWKCWLFQSMWSHNGMMWHWNEFCVEAKCPLWQSGVVFPVRDAVVGMHGVKVSSCMCTLWAPSRPLALSRLKAQRGYKYSTQNHHLMLDYTCDGKNVFFKFNL